MHLSRSHLTLCAALACVALGAATCWRWSGVSARMSGLEHVEHALEQSELGIVPVALARVFEMIDDLERIAASDAPASVAARHALDQLRKRLAR